MVFDVDVIGCLYSQERIVGVACVDSRTSGPSFSVVSPHFLGDGLMVGTSNL
jgi:hypothetical protein